MTIQQDEHFSALVDGELDEANSEIILNKLCKDEDCKQRWHRYHLISDSLKTKLPDTIDPKFSDSVMSAIENEPAIISPKPVTKLSPHSHIGKRFAGVAIAASVAVVALVSFDMNVEPEATPQLAQMPTSDEFVRLAKQKPVLKQVQPNIPANTPAMTVSSKASSSNTKKSIAKPIVKLDPLLHQYIINHSQRVSGGQLQGAMPYARIFVSPMVTQDR